ncbi:curli assembly protein CsgE [Azoarcus sp. Aa7]|nr:curli assembly protein CsgE [Azoarcus sp. Aa7]
MIRILPVVALLIAFCPPLPVAAANEDGPIDSGALTELANGTLEQATGFIVDRTITHFGGEFVRQFAQFWRTQADTGSVDLTIVEKPSARWGSTVIVEHNNRPVARVFLQAGSSNSIRPLAQNTAQYMAGRIANIALLNRLAVDPDLGKEELP